MELDFLNTPELGNAESLSKATSQENVSNVVKIFTLLF